MVFSDTTDLQGIVQDITFHTRADLNNYKIEDRVRRANQWYFRTILQIVKSVRSAVWKDTTITGPYTDNDWTVDPIDGSAVRDIGTGVRAYQLPTTQKPWIIYKVAYMRDGQAYYSASPFHIGAVGDNMNDSVLDDNIFQTAPMYRFNGDTIILYPTPNADVEAGLKIWFLPEPVAFGTNDTTKVPEMNKAFHDVISLGASYDFLRSRGKGNAEQVRRDLADAQSMLASYYEGFLDDEQPVLKADLPPNFGA